ncbi:MAG: ATP-binding protein [Nitrososphaerota archaeon]
MKTVAVVGPPGSGKTLVATSLALYLHFASARSALIDKTPEKIGAKLVGQYVKLAADLNEAMSMGVEYAVIDTPPYEVPKASKYMLVVEPFDLKYVPKELDDRTYLIVNKTNAILPKDNHIPFIDEIHWYYQHGVHPLLGDSPAMRKLRKRMGRLLKAVVEWL